jgi:hypothetical protein
LCTGHQIATGKHDRHTVFSDDDAIVVNRLDFALLATGVLFERVFCSLFF